MRKVLSFVLVLALVLGSFSMAFAATPTDVVGTPNEEAVQVLMGLGVVNGYADGSFKPAGIVTRAEMAKLIVVALGLEDYAVGTSKFPDMAGATWAQGYVNYAAGLGVIKGYPDGTFKPSATVSYDEAAAMIVRALGYTDGSLLPATWPANYVVKAKALGILDGVKSSVTGANRGDIAEMLYNALTVNMVSVDLENKITIGTDNMLLRLGAKFVAASVIYGDEDTLINLVQYTGVYAEKYTVDGDIVAVAPVSTNLYGEYTTSTGIFADADYDYTFLTTVASVKVPKFVNGVYSTMKALDATTSATTYDLAADTSGKKVTAVYAMAAWFIEGHGLFTAQDATSIKDTQSLMGEDFTLDDNDEINTNSFLLQGAKSLADIKVGNVVYVSAKNGIKRVQVGTEVVTGQVTKVSSNGKDYTIGGKIYQKSGETTDTIKIADTGTASLDYNGDIYDWAVTDSSEGNFAIVLAAATNTAIDNARIKLFTKDGSTTTFNVDAEATTVASIVTNFPVGTLVEYSTDKDGVIDVLTAKTLTGYHAQTLSKSGAVFAGQAVDSAVVVFTSTSVTSTALGTVDLGKLADVSRDPMANAKAYYNTTSGKIEVMVVDADATGVTADYAVLNTKASILNADGDTVNYFTGFKNGVALAAYADGSGDTNPTLAFATPGLYKVDTNTAGVITALTADANGVGSPAGLFKAYTTTVSAIDGTNLVKWGTEWLPIANNVVVYQLNVADGEYVVKTMSSVQVGVEASFWQIDTDSDGYDLIIIKAL
jgi:hypothetical protein